MIEKRTFHLAQINIAHMRASLEDPLMAGFVDRLDEINKLADQSKGFVWRLQTEEGDNTSLRAYEDQNILINMSLWESLDDLKHYVYRSAHAELIKQRREWFRKSHSAYAALWWVPAGHIPCPEEGMHRLDYLCEHGETPYAFSFKKPFSSHPAIEEGDSLSSKVSPEFDKAW